MSWLARLSEFGNTIMRDNKYTVEAPSDLDPVFISGSKFINDKIVCELRKEYPWVDVSNISFNSLCTRFKNDSKKILNYLINNRQTPKIYKHSTLDIILMTLVHRYLSKNELITCETVDHICKDTIQILYENNTYEKIISILDIRRCYFYEHMDCISELILYSATQLVLVSKKIYSHLSILLLLVTIITTTFTINKQLKIII